MARTVREVRRAVAASLMWLTVLVPASASAQNGVANRSEAPTGVAVVTAPDYVIGAFDHLSIVFWGENELSANAIVRPDGKISLPLLNDVQASGLTPDQLRQRVIEEAKRYVTDPNATIVVTAINSRKVFITGEVEKPGEFPLTGPMTVLQLIATAGGVKEYADKEKIVILRTENGKERGLRFNYKDVIAQRNMQQNVLLKPGDTVVVP
jgi:polysaccharide biosynthesis/export protein